MRETDAGVAGRALDHAATGTQFAALFRIGNDGARRPVLDRAAGIHELSLGEDLAAGLLADSAQPDQRRIADRGRQNRV